VGILWVSEFDDLMITTADGIVIRTPVSDLRLMGRATQGVKVIRIHENESIADVTVIRREEIEDEEE
jgi:DNA gyrase subunit A